ncbi:NAD(P)/FAD-dependent oxidoreductase [Arenimonas sp.]|uniref:NAD(P)/FAD-dependent oxidoreductase n=1 Tax=Arenimonas sp. TaxID=1872635 RepID=UPI0039E57551
MDLKSGYPFWAIRSGLIHAFPRLERDLRCDVAIVGGGITGAIVATELADQGWDVMLIEKRDIGWGSTAASTALLQYEIDTHLVDLARQYGENDAVLAYRACLDALDRLRAIAQGLRGVEFRRSDSLYGASSWRDVGKLREEFAMRKRHHFPAHWLERKALRALYGLDAQAAILSTAAAHVDPYRLTYRLLTRLQSHGVGVFDRSEIASIEAGARSVLLRLSNGVALRAAHAVIAGGYESQAWLPERVARNRSSYAFVTDPLGEERIAALRHTMFWESARPYLYVRATKDHRLVVGGEDDAIDVPAKRDRRVLGKAERMARKLQRHFPALEVRPTFCWAGTFAETKDGLPFFGPHPRHSPRLHFAMAYGGNGITYSAIGAQLISERLHRRRSRLGELFSFDRLRR